MAEANIFNNSYVFKAYELARAGFSEHKMADALGVARTTIRDWRKKHKIFNDAVTAGYGLRNTAGKSKFLDYVYKRLPEELVPLWNQIMNIDKDENVGDRAKRQLIDKLFFGKGMLIRQHIFLHALVNSNFNPSEACRKTGVSRDTLDNWLKNTHFARLWKEIIWHKKNFFEGALMGLVEAGDTSAIIFANRTYNADRGYTDKVQVQHQHTHTHTHAVVDVASLGLPLETQVQLLEAMRNKERLALEPHKEEEIIDIEMMEPGSLADKLESGNDDEEES